MTQIAIIAAGIAGMAAVRRVGTVSFESIVFEIPRTLETAWEPAALTICNSITAPRRQPTPDWATDATDDV